MRPDQLKYPFLNDSQKSVFVQDRVWYIPEKGVADYTQYKFPGWDSDDFFGNNNPVMLEYCSGNGAWIAARALANPHQNWVAVEKRFDRVRKIWSKIKNHQIPNLIVIYGEGLFTTRTYFPGHSLAGVFVNFPDPWPKRRHQRFRIVSTEFAEEVSRTLQPEGEVTLVTDHPEYSKQMIQVFNKHPHFQSHYPEPYYSNELTGYGTSYFEELWRQEGLVIHYHIFNKVC